MNVIEQFLRKVSYKFPKGYPDISDVQDRLMLEALLENFLGEEIKFVPLEYSELKKVRS